MSQIWLPAYCRCANVVWRGLAGAVRLSPVAVGNLRRSALFPRHDLPGCQLAPRRQHPRLSPNRSRLQLAADRSQARLRPPLAPSRPSSAVSACSRSPILPRSPEDHVDRRPDAFPLRVRCRYPRSSPRSGRRHSLAVVLAIAAAGVLCGMRGYKAISQGRLRT